MEMISTFVGFLLALTLTLIIELAVVYLLGLRKRNFFKVVFLVNVATNPVLNLILAVFGRGFDGTLLFIFTLLLEIIVIYVEYRMIMYVFSKQFTKERLFKLVLIMNGPSFLTGLLF